MSDSHADDLPTGRFSFTFTDIDKVTLWGRNPTGTDHSLFKLQVTADNRMQSVTLTEDEFEKILALLEDHATEVD